MRAGGLGFRLWGVSDANGRGALRYGVLQFFSWPGRRVPLPTVYERALQRIDVMDETGYDCVWLAEHHFNTYSVCPSVHLMGMHVAGRTKNIRIGTAVTLASFYHPLRIAEEVALLDVLSGGRVNWGAGRGFDQTEFRAFDVPVEESYPRFRESVQIVLEAWRNERVTWHGDYYDFDEIEVLPKPQQQPTPPFWVAAGSDDALDWAGEQGYSILMDPHAAHAEIGEKRRRYIRALENAGQTIEGRTLPMARLIAVAETDAEAEAIARNGAQWTVGSYGAGSKVRKVGVAPRDDAGRGVDPVQRYVDDVVIHGSASKVADTIAELRETIALDYLIIAPFSHDSFVRFTNDVLPRIA